MSHLAIVLTLFSGLAANAARLQIEFTAHRSLEMEPCGCTIKNYGGMTREWNFLRQWRSQKAESVVLAGGTLFEHTPDEHSAGDPPPQKRDYFLKGLTALGLNAASPGGRDVELGKVGLLEVSKQASFPFVSANLADADGKLLFPAVFEKANVVFVGVTTAQVPPGPGLKILPPVEAVSAAVAKYRTSREKSFFVVFGTLAPLEREQLWKAVPDVRVILGGQEFEPETQNLEFHSTTQVYANSLTRGRGAYVLDLDFEGDAGTFFDVDGAEYRERQAKRFEKNIAGLKKKLSAQSLSSDAKQGLENQIAQNQEALAKETVFAYKRASGMVAIQGKALPISKELESRSKAGANPAAKVVAEYKAFLRKRAINEVEEEE